MSGDCGKKNLRHAPYRFAVRPCYRRLLAAKVHWTICLSLHDPIRANGRFDAGSFFHNHFPPEKF